MEQQPIRERGQSGYGRLDVALSQSVPEFPNRRRHGVQNQPESTSRTHDVGELVDRMWNVHVLYGSATRQITRSNTPGLNGSASPRAHAN
jgi:hypothetical protein